MVDILDRTLYFAKDVPYAAWTFVGPVLVVSCAWLKATQSISRSKLCGHEALRSISLCQHSA